MKLLQIVLLILTGGAMVACYSTCIWYPVFRMIAQKYGYYYAYNGRPIPLTTLQYMFAVQHGFTAGILANILFFIAKYSIL